MDKLVSLLSSDIVLGWDLCPCPVDLGGGGGPSQCLNFGPSSEPGVNKGLGSLFSFFGCLLQLVFLPLSFCFREIIPCKGLSAAQRYISVGDVSPLYFTGNPSLS